jgi:two-component system, response regulator
VVNKSDILLVDDNENDVVLTERALKKIGIINPLVVARNAEKAIEYLHGEKAIPQSHSPCPALILVDIKLPRIDGLELLKSIRADDRTRTCPVALLASQKEDPRIQEALKLGVTSHIVKPVDFDQLSGAIRKLGLGWLVLDDPE